MAPLRKKTRKNEEGMTLVEMILAIAIFGVMSVVFLLIFSSGLMITVKAGHREKAVVEASGSLDQYKTDSGAPGAAAVEVAPAPVEATVTWLGSGASEPASDVWFYEYEAEVEGESVTLRGFSLTP